MYTDMNIITFTDLHIYICTSKDVRNSIYTCIYIQNTVVARAPPCAPMGTQMAPQFAAPCTEAAKGPKQGATEGEAAPEAGSVQLVAARRRWKA